MVFHMKTTLNLSDQVVKELKQEAARHGCTVSELVERALRLPLRARPPAGELPPLPEFDLGPARVDVADRDALYAVMDPLKRRRSRSK
jgi:hypothetical protein